MFCLCHAGLKTRFKSCAWFISSCSRKNALEFSGQFADAGDTAFFNASLVGLDAFHWTVPTSPCNRNRTGSATRCSLYWSNVPWRIICKWQIEPQNDHFILISNFWISLFSLAWGSGRFNFRGVKGDPLPFEATQWWQLVWMLGQLFHLWLLVRRWRQKSATKKQFKDISFDPAK